MAKNNKKTAPEVEKEQPAPEQTEQTQQSEQVPASAAANYGGEMEEQPQQTAGKESPKAKVKADGKTEKIAKSIFSEHPEEDTVYITSDGFGYFNEHDARNHARTLPNDEIVTITRQ